MRTRTNIYLNGDNESFFRIFGNFCSEGGVEVVCDDIARGKEIASAIRGDDYTVIITTADKYCGREYFCIAVGIKSYFAVKRSCKGKYACFVEEIFPELFSVRGKIPEFLYFDEKKYCCTRKDGVAECYSTLLCLSAEGLSALYSGSKEPFRDGALKSLLGKARLILTGNSDREGFFRESLGLCRETAERLFAYGVDRFLSQELAEAIGGGPGALAESGCFLHRSLILFTKWNFRDMLIPTSEIDFSESADIVAYGEEELVITDDDMKKLFGYVESFRCRCGKEALLSGLVRTIRSQDLTFAEINYRGIYEGIIEYG